MSDVLYTVSLNEVRRLGGSVNNKNLRAVINNNE